MKIVGKIVELREKDFLFHSYVSFPESADYVPIVKNNLVVGYGKYIDLYRPYKKHPRTELTVGVEMELDVNIIRKTKIGVLSEKYVYYYLTANV